jgi:hypothetical protein
MKLLAALLLASVTSTTSVALTAQPAQATAADLIAYAQYRTETWELVLAGGEVVQVPEALAKAPADAVNPGARAAFLISGDGRHFFYFRKRDGLFVERTVHGRERVVARGIKAYAIYEEWPQVSDDGRFVVMETSGPGIGVIADVRTGRTLPGPQSPDVWGFHGFSPDSKRMLMGGERLVVFDQRMRARTRLKSKQAPAALANDYVTAAVPVGDRKLRLLDVRTGKLGRTVTARLPRGGRIHDLDFDRSGQVTVRSKTKAGVAVYRLSPKTGKATLLRAIDRPTGAKTWVLPGDGMYERWTEK